MELTHAPDPTCYGCLGTGHIKWSGQVNGNRCPCTDLEYRREA